MHRLMFLALAAAFLPATIDPWISGFATPAQILWLESLPWPSWLRFG
jgi:hypothetical protein